MNSIKHAIHMIRPGIFLVSLGIKILYFVRACEVHRKFLQFMQKEKHYSLMSCLIDIQFPCGYLI